jgi:hypothetical protein
MAEKMSPEDLNDLKNATSDVSTAIKGLGGDLSKSGKELKQSGIDLGSALLRGASGASVYNDVIEKASKLGADAARKYLPAGEAIGTATELLGKAAVAVNKQADALFENYQKISRSGIALGMEDTFKNLQDAGYTMAEIGKYGSLMQENSTVLARLGGTTADGATAFAKAAKNIHESGLETTFMNMGMTVSDINSGMANYIKQQQLSGSTLQQDDKQIAQSASEFILQQDKLTKLTGFSADEQNKIYETAMASEQFAAHTYELQKKAAAGGAEGEAAKKRLAYEKEVMMYARAQGPETAKQFQMMIAGDVTSKAYQSGSRTFAEAKEILDSGSTDAAATIGAANRGAKQATDNWGHLAKTGNYAAMGGSYAEQVKMNANVNKNYVDIMSKISDQQRSQGDGTDAAVKAEVQLRQNQRDITKTADLALNKAVSTVTTGMAGLSILVQQLTSLLDPLLGKTGQVGGGTSLPQKMGEMFGLTGGGPAGPLSEADKSKAESLLKFSGGNTGSKANFDALDEKTKNAFLAMVNEYGKPVSINSAKRELADQKRLYDAWAAAGGSDSNPIVNVPGMGRIRKPTKPGSSDSHIEGRAIDLDDTSYSGLAPLLGKYGFQSVAGDPGHIQLPSAKEGGILSGPTSGYKVIAHGTEAVVPTTANKSIPVQTKNSGESKQTTKLLSMELERLDSMLAIMSKQNSISNRMLQLQH